MRKLMPLLLVCLSVHVGAQSIQGSWNGYFECVGSEASLGAEHHFGWDVYDWISHLK